MNKLLDLLLVLAMVALTPVLGNIMYASGITVVATFQSVADDVRLLVCDDDKVHSLVAPGADPHDYQLAPKDFELLSRADLIVSTAHTHFESKIAELVRSGYLKAVLVEIPSIEGVRLLRLPDTNTPNYHAITYDPDNYVAFVRNISGTLISLRPSCREVYLARLDSLLMLINSIKGSTSRVYIKAIASSPQTQYAVTWLGIDIKRFVVKDHEVPLLPADVMDAETMVREGLVNAVVVLESNDEVNILLQNLAVKYSLPVIRVPPYASPGDTPTKLARLVEGVSSVLGHRGKADVAEARPLGSYDWLLPYIMVVFVVGVVSASAILARRYIG